VEEEAQNTVVAVVVVVEVEDFLKRTMIAH